MGGDLITGVPGGAWWHVLFGELVFWRRRLIVIWRRRLGRVVD